MAAYKSKDSRLVNHPSIIENAGMKFLIFDAPSDDNIEAYIQMFNQHNVTHVVRVCDPTYSIETIEASGIAVHDMPFPDGDAPPKAVVEAWLSVCKKVFKNSTADQPAIGIHCVAGLGRAPILVSIALIESGLDAVAAVTLIRNKRKGAINRMQLQYLKKYKKSGGCIIL